MVSSYRSEKYFQSCYHGDSKDAKISLGDPVKLHFICALFSAEGIIHSSFLCYKKWGCDYFQQETTHCIGFSRGSIISLIEVIEQTGNNDKYPQFSFVNSIE